MEKKEKKEKDRESEELELLPTIDLDEVGMSLQPKISQEFNENTNLFNIVDNFSELENNLFFACIAQVNDRGPSTVKFSVQAMRKMVGYKKHISMTEFADLIMTAFEKFLNIQEEITGIDENGRPFKYRANLFNSGMVYVDNLECIISVSPRFTQLFNDLERWTRFSIIQYTKIHSVYSKKLFILLKQFRTTGVRYFSIEEFNEKINPPKSYSPSKVNKKIVEPAVEDLAPFFRNLRFIKKYKKGIRGRKLAGYEFQWVPEYRNQKDFQKNRMLEESQELYNIKSNFFLTQEQKFRAVDRLRGVRLGTTQRMYKSEHPNTVFWIPESKPKKSSKPVFIRGDLDEAKKYSVRQLVDLVKFYEDLNKSADLMLNDQNDLKALEMLLISKVRSAHKKKVQAIKDTSLRQEYASYYDKLQDVQRKDIIAYQVMADLREHEKEVLDMTENQKQRFCKLSVAEKVNSQWGCKRKLLREQR